MSEYDLLYLKIGYAFKDIDLVRLAVTHSSVGAENYERLEYLGDAFLDFAVGEYLYSRHPKAPEGSLTQMRAQLVGNSVLCNLFDEWDLAKYVRAQNLSLRHLSEKVRANFVESLVGAIYLDGGFENAMRFVQDTICTEHTGEEDYISRLHEFCVAAKRALVIDERDVGEVGKPCFEATVTVDGAVVATARGDSKKRARQSASREALAKMKA